MHQLWKSKEVALPLLARLIYTWQQAMSPVAVKEALWLGQVLPDQTLPTNAPALEQAVRESLRQATLSIHLIGTYYLTVRLNQEAVLRIAAKLGA